MPSPRHALAALVCTLALVLATAVAQTPPREVIERAYRSNNAGVAWLERFEYARAADAFRDALRLAPSLAIARFNLALALFYDGKLDAARQEVSAARTMGGPRPDYLLGLIGKAEGRQADAAAAFARVLESDPEDAAASVMLGQTQLQQGNAKAAIVRLQRALELEPTNATAAYNLSVALSRDGHSADAQRVLQRFQTLRESGAAITLGNGYLEQGPYAEAIASTGAERELVDRRVPDVRFVSVPLATRATPADALDPVGRRFTPGELDTNGRRRIAEGMSGGLTLVDIDGDGDLDLLEVSAAREYLWRNRQGQFVRDASVRFARPQPGAIGVGAVAGDYNNDGRPDLLILRYGGTALYRNDGGGRFTDVTGTAHLRSAPTELPLAAAFADVDHDGDLDIVLPGFVDLDGRGADGPAFPDGFPAAPLRLWRNNGDGTFTDVTGASRLTGGRVTALVPTDYDRHRDIDLALSDATGRLALFSNHRDGSFQDVAREAGLNGTGALSSLAAADLNRDGRPDLLAGRTDGPAVLFVSAGRSRFRASPAPGGLAGVLAAQLFDYDGDGVTDLLAWTPHGLRLLRSLGDDWQDVTDRALGTLARQARAQPLTAARAIVIADFDADGDEDILLRSRDGLRLLRNDGGDRAGALAVRLRARISNRSGAGARVEMRAGSLAETREVYAATPSPAPADVAFGLGGRQIADAVRVLWPAGIVQAELQPPRGRPLVVEELNRKPSSCPYLFAWNGQRFAFVTDFLGGGELGYWLAPGERATPDPDEYVRIPGDALVARDNRYLLRVTNELEEVLFLDHVRLDVVTHRTGVDVYPLEGLLGEPRASGSFQAVRNVRPMLAAVDDSGSDVRPALASIDRRYADGFPLQPIRGYARRHTLTVYVDDRADLLLLTGWTDYAFSSDNVAASQRGLPLEPPSVEIRDARGRWRTAIADIGVPVGRPQTIVLDLRQPALAGRRELRIATSMRVYWDRIAAADVDRGPVERRSIAASSAHLSFRGFSSESSPDGREPFAYDYDRVTTTSHWKTPVGDYTAPGDVRDRLERTDDRFVVAAPGDEIALAFDARGLPPVPLGWTRTFLLYADGFSKEMDINSASPDSVRPVPSHGMRDTPGLRDPAYGAAGRGDPAYDPAARRIRVPFPSIDVLLLPLEQRHR
jgi:Tfp pilus assembly protein PilF